MRCRRWVLWLGVGVLLVNGFLVGGGAYMLTMPGRSHEGPLPPLTPTQVLLREELQRDLTHLAVDIGERNLYRYANLRETADWLDAALGAVGYEAERQGYEVGDQRVENLVAQRPGTDASDEIVVVGAHYDTVRSCPGANDNGTGVVGTLALARRWAARHPKRTLRFVFFVNEEPPHFRRKSMGSLVYARGCRARGENVVAMFTLETIGYYSDAEKSQRYPFPISVFYPSTADFIAFVSNLGSRRLVRRMVKSFRRHAAFPSEGAAAPSWISGVGWSDHWSFWQAGYPGVMVTDTALFRYAAYHTPEDTVDRIDFDRLARVVDGLEAVVAELSATGPDGS